ncbi:hypothetical protein GE061_018217 [Apolygus lucorum]|uniref:Uncharacterized protein n=1 Tax=Apolygus lucorum TaxID=248454 RepID=A0A8S9XD52_APOLU|nr:hypothetical protein GE061_018217 [Apolygus lucorum]
MRALATRPPPESRHLPDGAPLPHSLRDFGCAESESLPRLGPPIQPLSTSWFQRLRLPSTASDFFNTQDCKTTTAPTLHGLLQLVVQNWSVKMIARREIHVLAPPGGVDIEILPQKRSPRT